MSRKTLKRVIEICRQSTINMDTTEIKELQKELLDLLQEENTGPNVVYPRCRGSVPLCEACRSGNEAVVDVLLQQGADPNHRDKNKSTPLYIAASQGHQRIVKKLLDVNADVNARNVHGYLPLLSAVENNHMDVAALLVESGADVNIKRPNTFGIEMTLMTFVLFAKNDIPFAEKLLEAGVIPHPFEKPLNFILLEYGDECRHFIKKLVSAGFNFYCDGWIKLTKSKMAAEIGEVSESEKDMMEFLEYEHCNATSLQRFCRTAIRRCLSKSEQKISIQSKISQLPLPQEVKRYLSLDYL